jgi:hypothetical protein
VALTESLVQQLAETERRHVYAVNKKVYRESNLQFLQHLQLAYEVRYFVCTCMHVNWCYVYSGEYDVTPSVHPCTPGKLTNLPGHSGNRTHDLSY